MRRVFGRRELTFDYALVSLELAVLLLEQGHTTEVGALAEEMLRIFRTQKIEREALVALHLFCDAAHRRPPRWAWPGSSSASSTGPRTIPGCGSRER